MVPLDTLIGGHFLEIRTRSSVTGRTPDPARNRARRSLAAGAAMALVLCLPLPAIPANGLSENAEHDLGSNSVRTRLYAAANLYNASDQASAAAPMLVKMLPTCAR
jgi:hypothetical protein